MQFFRVFTSGYNESRKFIGTSFIKQQNQRTARDSPSQLQQWWRIILISCFITMRVAKTFLPLLVRNTPHLTKKLILPTFFILHHIYSQKLAKVYCSGDANMFGRTISNIQDSVIRIQREGNVVGEAYCFANNYLISVSYQLEHNENYHTQKNYEYYIGQKKLEGNFKIVGQFENLTFIQHDMRGGPQPLEYEKSHEQFSISAVQIFKKKQYPSVKNGYLVAQDSGFGIIDGRGDIGSLVIKEGKPIGIVTHIGRGVESDFLRIIEWKNLPKILNYLKQKNNIHFGISAQVQPFKEGIQVVRIAPNSPLRNDVMMGDQIISANKHKISEVESLKRICIMSEGQLTLQVMRDDAPIEINVKVY